MPGAGVGGGGGGRINAVDEISRETLGTSPIDPVEDEGRPARRPFTFASLWLAVGVCVAWWSVGLTAYFGYAHSRSDAVAAAGCVEQSCPSERAALLTAGYFGLLPTAFVGVLISLVVLVYAARSLRVPWLLGTLSALAGMVLGAVGFLTIATYDVVG